MTSPQKKRDIIVICGPTASGKSALASRLAQHLACEIVSADSVQVFREFDLGTSKPSLKERDQIKYHLVDILDPREAFSAHDFQQRADESIKAIHSRARIPLVVGGSSLYVQALLQGLFDAPKRDDMIRRRHQKLMSDGRLNVLYEQLVKVDPASANIIHRNDALRISRALEVYEQTGTPISAHRKKHQFGDRRYNAIVFSISLPKERLRDRVRSRVDTMIERGLVDEVQSLLKKGYEDTQGMGALGYRQIKAHFSGEMTLEMAISKTKKLTWAFAKRQIRHIRKFERELGLISLDCQSPVDIDMSVVLDMIQSRLPNYDYRLHTT